jgi:predicted nucleic acid-binding protein
MPAFWDTSAIIHICVPGQSASAARRVLEQHPVVVWWTARVEVRSVLERLRNEGVISPRAYDASRTRLEALLGSWREIVPTDSLRELACVQLERFPIRAADALHLGAALIWCKQKPRGRLFVCNDLRLGDAARQAGFTVEAV